MAMTVESKLSMKNAVATIEATTSGRAWPVAGARASVGVVLIAMKGPPERSRLLLARRGRKVTTGFATFSVHSRAKGRLRPSSTGYARESSLCPIARPLGWAKPGSPRPRGRTGGARGGSQRSAALSVHEVVQGFSAKPQAIPSPRYVDQSRYMGSSAKIRGAFGGRERVSKQTSPGAECAFR
jgi:hypothetical protein